MTPKFTDQQVREAVYQGYSLSKGEWSDRIIWAAQRYLEAKEVIEWYGDEHGECQLDMTFVNGEPLTQIAICERCQDEGQRAREFLEGELC